MRNDMHLDWGLGGMAAAIAVAGLLGCEKTIEDPKHLPTVEHVQDNPDPFLGETITLTGEVDEVYSDRAFVLEEMQWIFDSEVLVVTRSPIDLGFEKVTDDKLVTVTGTVRKLVVAELEEELGWDLDEQLEVDFREHPVLVADRVDAMQSYAHWSEKDEPEGTLVSLWSVYYRPHPTALPPTKVELEHVKVGEKGQSGLWVGRLGAPDLFVVPADAASMGDLDKGMDIDIRGTLKRLPLAEGIPDGWKLTEVERERLGKGSAYIEASSLERSPSSDAAQDS